MNEKIRNRLFFGIVSACLLFGLIFCADVALNYDNIESKEIEIEGEIVGVTDDHIIMKTPAGELIHVEYRNKENLIETENGILAYNNEHKLSNIYPSTSSTTTIEPQQGRVSGLIIGILPAALFLMFLCISIKCFIEEELYLKKVGRY